MATRLTAAFAVLALLALAPALTGCELLSEDAPEGVAISPTPAGPAADPGLGPEARPLSFGPGDKGSPRPSPDGDRVAFVLDGYATEKPLYAQEDPHRRTAKNFGALSAEWLPDGSLAILAPEDEDRDAKTASAPNSLFTTQPDGSSNVSKLTGKVLAVGSVPDGQAIVAAVARTPTPGSSDKSPRSRLVLLRGPEESAKVSLGGHVEGYVTGLSVSPDGRQAVLAVRRDTGEGQGFEVQVYRFSEGKTRRVARVPEGMEILGAPQWTPRGVYFVAGQVDDFTGAARGGDSTLYALYRASESSETSEPVRGVGEDFVAASISVSPDGGRLAVVGRRNPGSPTNLYVLDLASETLEAATTNENMEIKTNPRDLVWSPDGRCVILVARGALSGPEVYNAPAKNLSSAFYNLYEVPVGDGGSGGG